jgi:hypothetical protein
LRPTTTTLPAGARTSLPGAAAARRLVLAAACLAVTAHAQEPSAVDVSAARTLGQEGSRLADEGRCEEAVEKLERAERLYHAPTLLGRLGECQVALGKVVQGVENLQRVAREPLPAGAPSAFTIAKARAQRALEQAVLQLARLRVNVRAPADAHPSVTVDGEPLPAARLNAERPTDPGAHVVEASAPGYLKAAQKVKLAPGEALTITLALERDPALARPPSVDDAASSRGALAVAPATGGPSTWTYVALGVGAVGVASGAVLGVMTLSRKGDLEDKCPKGACPSADQQGDIDSMKRLGDLSTVAFAVGGVGLGVGALLWWLGPSRPESKRARVGNGLALGAWAAGSTAGLQGSFP